MNSSTDRKPLASEYESGNAAPASPSPKPVRIGSVVVNPPLILAPMAGVTDTIYRAIMAAYGVGMVTTEMVSVAGLLRGQRESWRLCGQDPPLSVPLAVQIFGCDPEAASEAARHLEAAGVSLIDINAGCPIKKVVRQGAGASLLKDESRLVSIVQAMKRAVSIPVTVKLRLGWDGRNIKIVELARRLSAAGVDAITIHGRTAVQGFSGRADWTYIGEVKDAVDIPVIGNGDIRNPVQANEIIRQTGCDAVMIGRAAMGNPWLLSAIAAEWGYGNHGFEALTWADFYEAALHHFQSFRKRWPHATGHLKALIIWYSRGCPNASRLRNAVCRLEQPEEMLSLFHGWVHEIMVSGLPFFQLKVLRMSGEEGSSWIK